MLTRFEAVDVKIDSLRNEIKSDEWQSFEAIACY